MRRALRPPFPTPGLLVTTALVALAGCANPVGPRFLRGPEVTGETGAPEADTPVHLAIRLKWTWEHQDVTMYRELFTDDYVFVFAAADSAGRPPFGRGDELTMGRHLFAEGTATEPCANRITLDYVSELVPRPDRRPGKAYPWHQEILANVVLKVYTDDYVHQIDGRVLFFVVRGDSALIPGDLEERGFGPDSTHWYIERWEDHTDASGLAPRASTAATGAVRPLSACAGAVPARFRFRPAPTGAGRAALARAMRAAERRP